MTTKLEELGRRKELLISRSAFQREQLAHLSRQIQRPATLVKAAAGAFQVFRTVKTHPRLATSLAAVLMGSLRPRLAKLALPLWTAWWVYGQLKSRRSKKPGH